MGGSQSIGGSIHGSFHGAVVRWMVVGVSVGTEDELRVGVEGVGHGDVREGLDGVTEDGGHGLGERRRSTVGVGAGVGAGALSTVVRVKVTVGVHSSAAGAGVVGTV